ncbi:MAG: cupin domain-containing protein [Acidobacteriota bacterium]
MHPPEDILLSFVSGEADLARRALIEGHLDGCPDCRASIRSLSVPGARLLAGMPGKAADSAGSSGLWDRLRARVAEIGPPPSFETSPLAQYPVPAGALRELGDRSGVEPQWRFAGTIGAAFTILSRDAGTGAMLLLGRIKPAKFFPEHRHAGLEEILILRGGFEDQYGDFTAGMYTSYEPGTVHRPWIDEQEPCWMLSRLEKPVEFLGWRGVAQRMLGN